MGTPPPRSHQHALAGGGRGTRVVLADWGMNESGNGSYLRVDAHGLQQLPLGA
jgi:hypothetical protein